MAQLASGREFSVSGPGSSDMNHWLRRTLLGVGLALLVVELLHLINEAISACTDIETTMELKCEA